jgi:ornithine cyclodeaminase
MILAELPEILQAIDEREALAAVEEGFLRQARGELELMAVGHLDFPEDGGSCHVKGGHLRGDDVFVVKMSNTFHRNPARGLSPASGYMSIASARTGELLAILHDRGYLTDLRTAMAGALAARTIARPRPQVLGVIGSGVQAEMQAQWIARTLGIPTTLLWARNVERAGKLAAKLGAQSVPLASLCELADVIVTTTPSTEPILTSAMVRPGTRIVAVGADAPGKRELDTALLARARIVVDSRAQCVDHGETGWAVRAGVVDADDAMQLADLLAEPVVFADDDIVIADLTGVAVQDVQIAKAVLKRLVSQREAAR